MIRKSAALGIALLPCPHIYGAIVVGSDSALWTPIAYASGVVTDYPQDTQATSLDLDIVGDTAHPGFYTFFDNGGTTGIHTDGEVAFRLRMAGDQGQPTFAGQAWVGLDVDTDGSIDLFIGASTSGLTIRAAGSDANISPSTTSIASASFWSAPVSNTNYLWTAVSAANDSLASDYDLENEVLTSNDYFLSFIIPFNQLVDAVTTLTGVTTFDDTAPLGYIAATASQGNVLNSDLNGVNGGVNSSVTWTDLGGISTILTVDGTPYSIPEPPGIAYAGAGLAILILLLRRLRRSPNMHS